MTIELETSDTSVRYAIGIDLGGTFIKAGVVDSKGKLYNQFEIESYSEVSPQKVMSQIVVAIKELQNKFKREISGIGIGSPGIVTNGVVKYPPNFRNWKEVKLGHEIEKKFATRVFLNNDAKCAGLAELKFGHGKKYNDFIFLTLGTGIGGAIFIDGKLYPGEQNGAGEFGMTSINFNGPDFKAGNKGAIEAYVGRRNFLKTEKKLITKLGKYIDFKELADLASKNNKTAKELFKKYGFYLGVALTNYFNLMDVRTAVLGGGISNCYKYFISKCNKTIKERSLKTIRNEFRVLRSELSNNAGVLGAAAQVFGP
jgi:glucokinase